MDMATSCVVWFTIVLGCITVLIANGKRRRKCTGPAPPPTVKGVSVIRVIHTLLTRGLRAMIHDQYTKLGSDVFTISFFGLKVTFLIGPEVSGHFYQGSDSDLGFSHLREYTVPMIGKEVGYGVDIATRNEQFRFFHHALRPAQLRSLVGLGPMLQEVEDYFSKWGQQGMVDLKQELGKLLMLIAGRCLLGKEVREKMFDEFLKLLHEVTDNGMCMASVLFPYAPIPSNRRRDRARAKLLEMFTKIVRSRKSHNHNENDVLQSLIDSKYGDGRSTTEAEVTSLIMALLIAGKTTSTVTSVWTGAHMLANTRCLTSVLEEQKAIVTKYGDHLDYNAFLEMDTLHRCIKEALRIHPPAPVLSRKVHKNFTVHTKDGNEYEIHRGHTIVSPVLFSNNLPHIYKDPDVYDPDRFGPGREEDKAGGKYAFTTFGGGRHACIGESYTYLQIKVIWSHLLRNFELKLKFPVPGTDGTKLTLEPKGRVMVSYKKRPLSTT